MAVCSFLFHDGKPKHSPGWDSVSLSWGHLAYPKMPEPQQRCRELGMRWAEAFGPSGAGSSLSSPGISDAPGSQACIHLPLAFADGLWEQQRPGCSSAHLSPLNTGRKAQQSRGRARGAAALLPGKSPWQHQQKGLHPLHCQENLGLDWMLLQG